MSKGGAEAGDGQTAGEPVASAFVAPTPIAAEALSAAFKAQALSLIDETMKRWTPAAGRRIGLRLEIDEQTYGEILSNHPH